MCRLLLRRTRIPDRRLEYRFWLNSIVLNRVLPKKSLSFYGKSAILDSCRAGSWTIRFPFRIYILPQSRKSVVSVLRLAALQPAKHPSAVSVHELPVCATTNSRITDPDSENTMNK